MQKSNTPMAAEVKASLKVVFLTLFLDMVGFSIIFPLFPALVKHYLAVDPNNFFLRGILDGVTRFIHAGAAESVTMNITASTAVLFGGVLAAIYSFLQFVFSPFWGSLSDRVGRKPILLISITGTILSYVLWFFSGSFTLLVVARFIAGMMSGNISTATAVVGDITTRENRAKGMAIIGMAFGIGFILGPALGGIASIFDLTATHPEWAAYGVNPFSSAALIALALAVANLVSVIKNFKESLPPEKCGKREHFRTANVFQLFKPLPYRGVNATNFANFLYTLAFAGMEFTLTFLADERFSYTARDNAKMFIFTGILMALIQGGVVRRHAHRVGEKKMTILGLALIIPGLILVSSAYNAFALYMGLGLIATGAAMVIACLTALVSLYTPEESQGQSIGVFRSLGSLGRVIGPFAACLLYWRYGSASPYYASAVFMVIPILLVLMLEAPDASPAEVARA